MPVPKFVTFTGVDKETDFDELSQISEKYPVEWGVLIGNGESNRYVDEDFIRTCFEFDNDIVDFSLHLCGQYVNWALLPISAKFVSVLVQNSRIKRIQLNANTYDLSSLICFQRAIDIPVIVQVRSEKFLPPIEGITYLHDKSGGRGILPEARPIQEYDDLVGYAGGIGPDNVLHVLSEIKATNFYIDMESKIRTDDLFDTDKCEEVCKQIWSN